MAVRIRLSRIGRRNRPEYKIVVTDRSRPRDSASIEDLGRYYPLRDPGEAIIEPDRAMHWLRNGADPSDSVRSIFSERGLMLRLHLERKGKSEEEIEEMVSEWREEHGNQDITVRSREEAQEDEDEEIPDEEIEPLVTEVSDQESAFDLDEEEDKDEAEATETDEGEEAEDEEEADTEDVDEEDEEEDEEEDKQPAAEAEDVEQEDEEADEPAQEEDRDEEEGDGEYEEEDEEDEEDDEEEDEEEEKS